MPLGTRTNASKALLDAVTADASEAWLGQGNLGGTSGRLWEVADLTPYTGPHALLP